MKKAFQIFIAIASPFICYCQIVSQNMQLIPDTAFLDNGEFHKTLKKYISELPESYFVLTVDTRETPHISGVHLLRDYREIKGLFACPYIYWIINREGGINENTVDKYFNQQLKIPFNNDIKERMVFNDSLLNKLLKNSDLMKTFYVYRKRLYYEGYSKNKPLRSHDFPYDLVEVKIDRKIKLSNNEFLQSNINIIHQVGEYLLQKAEIDNTVRLINPYNGEIIKIFNIEKEYNGVEIYQKYIARNKKDVEKAQKFYGYLENINRREFPIWSAYVNESAIYLATGLQVVLPNPKNYKFYDDLGNYKVIKKGEPIGELYALLWKIDTELNVQNIYHVRDEESMPKKVQNYIAAGIDYAFVVKENYIYVPSDYMLDIPEFEVTKNIKRSKYYNKGVCRLIINNDEVIFDDVQPVPLARDVNIYPYNLIYPGFFEWNNILYFYYDLAPEVYNVQTGEIVHRLNNTGNPEIPEHFKYYAGDTIEDQYNWSVLASGTIYENNYACFLYLYQGTPLLEVVDKSWNTIQLIELTNIEGMQHLLSMEKNSRYDATNITFTQDNGFYAIIYEKEKGEHFLYHYEINLAFKE